jgi:hypothetical protein
VMIVGDPDRPKSFLQRGRMPDGKPIEAVHMISGPHEVDQKGDPTRPHAYLVRQSPHSVLAPHFHRSRQFQVVVEGAGHIGRHAVAPVSVHYTSAEAGYGPLVASDQGLSYMTLRQKTEFWRFLLPEEAREMTGGLKRRQFTVSSASVSAEGLAALDGIKTETLIPLDDTGLTVSVLRVPPNVPAPHEADEAVLGRYYVVAGGTIIIDDDVLPHLGVMWVSADEAPQSWRAGSGGAEVVVLQFPDRD